MDTLHQLHDSQEYEMQKSILQQVELSERIEVTMLPTFDSEFPRIKNHSAVFYKDKIYIFGGYNGQKNLNKLHIFDPRTNSLHVEKFTNDKDLPEGRNGHASVVIANKMYVIGGWIGKGFYASSQLYILDLDTIQWRKVLTQGTEPGPCNMHTAEHYKDKIYVYRGGDGKCYLSDLHSLDIHTAVWEKVETKGYAPPPRANHASAIIRDKMYIFGGWDGLKRLNDLFRLNLLTFEWEEIDSEKWLVAPPPRAGMKMLSVENCLYMFGGSGPSSTCYNDLWTYDPDNNKWLQCKVTLSEQLGENVAEGNDQSGDITSKAMQITEVVGNSEVNKNRQNGDHLENFLSPRSGHSMTLCNNLLFIVGGSWGLNYYKNFIILDIDPKPEIIQKSEESQEGRSSNFLSSLRGFYNNPQFSDLQLNLSGEIVYAHKIVLSSLGQSFLNMFTLGMKESLGQEISINTVNPLVFKVVLKSLYSNQLDLSTDQSMNLELLFELLQFCDQYLIEKMFIAVVQKIKDLVTPQNVDRVVQQALQFNCPILAKYCRWYQRRNKIISDSPSS